MADRCPICQAERCDPLQHAVDEHNPTLQDEIRKLQEQTDDPDSNK